MECERVGVGRGERLVGCVRGVASTFGTHASGVLCRGAMVALESTPEACVPKGEETQTDSLRYIRAT
jgi:hypothetical protein